MMPDDIQLHILSYLQPDVAFSVFPSEHIWNRYIKEYMVKARNKLQEYKSIAQYLMDSTIMASQVRQLEFTQLYDSVMRRTNKSYDDGQYAYVQGLLMVVRNIIREMQDYNNSPKNVLRK